MKATLHFDINHERDEFDTALRANYWKGTVADLDEWLRSELKYNNELPDANSVIYQQVRDKLYEIIKDYGIEL